MTSMSVSNAVTARRSVRAFTSDPVPDETLRSLVDKAARAPSGGNVQPWRIYGITSATMASLRSHLSESEPVEAPGYEIYPPKLWEPYRTNRFRNGEMLYATLGLEREDKAGRLEQFARNGDFFGAQAAIFCYVDKRMGPPQWSDLGMYLQTFMLLAEEAGLNTCPQEYWTVRQNAIGEFVGAPDDVMLFCGVALGHADPDAPVNTLVTERQPLEEFATFL